MKKVLIVLALSSFLLASCGGSGEVSDNENILSDEDQALIESVTAVIPPDPGEAGKATLAGIDSDNDGVRDDVEIKIIEEFKNDENTLAKAIVASIKIKNMTTDDWKNYSQYKQSNSYSILDAFHKVVTYHLNTEERVQQYRDYFSSRSIIIKKE